MKHFALSSSTKGLFDPEEIFVLFTYFKMAFILIQT